MLEDDVKFRITVKSTKNGGPCYAGHKPGDTFECGYLTPEGLCGWAYHSIYPFIHALRHTESYKDTDYRLVKKDTVQIACPDNAWVIFEVEKL